MMTTLYGVITHTARSHPKNLARYDHSLEAFSKPLMRLVEK